MSTAPHKTRGSLGILPPVRETVGGERIAEEKMDVSLSFLLHSKKNLPLSTTSSGSPVASLTLARAGPSKNARQNTTSPGGNQTGEHE